MEYTLLGAALVGVIPVYLVLHWEARRAGTTARARELWDITLGAAAAGVLVGRLAAMATAGVNPITHPADILIVRGGVATGPAALAALATAAWLGKRELWFVLDGLAPAALVGLGGWHAGCLVRGTCLGTPSRLPWAAAQNGSVITRHPVEIYAALALFAGAVALELWRVGLRTRPGLSAGMALAVAATVRLATEPLRPSLSGGPVGWYVAGALVGVGEAAWALRRHRHRVAQLRETSQ
jgi:prolipoprotein diacylglyceryltransferase